MKNSKIGRFIRREGVRRALTLWGALILIVFGMLLLFAPQRARGAVPIKVPISLRLSADHWTTTGGMSAGFGFRRRGCALENGSFLLPLKEGDNEVVIALANNFYGWGIQFRPHDLEGVRLAD